VVRVGCKWLPACLEPCALVVGGYLCTLELVPWSLYLGACALVVRVGCKWLPAYLEPCALLVAAGWLLVACLGACALLGAGWKWLPA